ncbi:MAG TPA: lipocalin-like domain-containing protein [Thermoanaerobaculia bacterium]|nr:lipocalin-like domain-containing protein [Thermoanaerobaculia bacterium]
MQRVLRVLSVAVLAVSLLATLQPSSAAPATAGKDLLGTWRLVSYQDWDASGKLSLPYGEHPRGYIVFDATGHVSINVMRMPALPPFTSKDEDVATPGEKQAAYDAYTAYFGTYSVEPGRFVTHVEGSPYPSYTNTDQPRPFVLSGDTLILGDEKTWKRVPERVR